MKIIILLLMVQLAFFANASVQLDKDQIQTVVESVNNACGDSWCEGPFMYDFVSFSCLDHDDMCLLTFVATEDEKSYKAGSCLLMPAYENLDDYVDPKVEGVWPTQKFYEFVSDCLISWETKNQDN